MSTRLYMASGAALRLLGKVFAVLCILFFALAAWWTVRYMLHQSGLKDSLRTIAKNESETEAALKLVAQAETLQRSLKKGLTAVAGLQSDLERIATEEACFLEQFEASPDLSPYLSRFKKVTSSEGWQQVEVRLSLRGRLKNVVRTLQAMQNLDVLFEYNALELARTGSTAAGEAIIEAKVEFRVITRA